MSVVLYFLNILFESLNSSYYTTSVLRKFDKKISFGVKKFIFFLDCRFNQQVRNYTNLLKNSFLGELHFQTDLNFSNDARSQYFL
jgi:hypothetical protein